jgi:alkylated DNA repair dioxygenase AlkB
MELLDIYELDVPGLYYIDNIKHDTVDIINELDKKPWTALSKASNSRLVQHYGYKYNYTTYQINEPCEPLPSFLQFYQKLLYDTCISLDLIAHDYKFNQCIVNNYVQGQGISAHIDVKQYGRVIGCFTIGSGTTVFFEKEGEKKEIYVEPNSLYIMSGDARYVWRHSIPSRKSDVVDNVRMERGRRISITFRNVPNHL